MDDQEREDSPFHVAQKTAQHLIWKIPELQKLLGEDSFEADYEKKKQQLIDILADLIRIRSDAGIASKYVINRGN